MLKLIAAAGCLLIATAGLSAADINLDFLKRLAADKGKHDELQTEGKPQKAQTIWDQNNSKLQSLFKPGVWYTLPSNCAAYRREFALSDQITIECQISDITSKEQTTPKIDLKLLSQKLTLKWEDATNDVPYDIKFKVAKYRDTGFVPFKVGYIHTYLDGFTLYVDAFQILGKKKVADAATSSEDDSVFKEKMALMIREVNPMLQTIDPLPESLPKPKGCYAPNEGVSKTALTEMQRLVKEKNLSLDTSDLIKFGSLELCTMANPNKADDACLDACIEKVFEAWK